MPFFTPEAPYIPEQGSIGGTIYAELNTGGVGLNVSSYLQYSGNTDGFDMPAEYEFNELQAEVFGTNISVSCQNATASYTEVGTRVDIGFVTVMAVSKPNGPNITVFNNLQGGLIDTSLVIGSAVMVESDTGEPIHSLVIPDLVCRLPLSWNAPTTAKNIWQTYQLPLLSRPYGLKLKLCQVLLSALKSSRDWQI